MIGVRPFRLLAGHALDLAGGHRNSGAVDPQQHPLRRRRRLFDILPLERGCIPLFVAMGGSALSGVARVLRPGVAIWTCAVQHESIPGAVSEDPRTAGDWHPGASRRDTGRGVSPSGSGGVFARFDGRGGGVVWRYWREFEAAAACGGAASEADALRAAVAAEFVRSLPQMRAALRSGRIPDLDAIEMSRRGGLPGHGTTGCAALLEAFDAELPPPSCPRCGRRMDRNGRVGKTCRTRFGSVKIERRRFRCRACGGSHFPLDRALGLEGKTVTPGAESLYADAASSDSYGQASRKCN